MLNSYESMLDYLAAKSGTSVEARHAGAHNPVSFRFKTAALDRVIVIGRDQLKGRRYESIAADVLRRLEVV